MSTTNLTTEYRICTELRGFKEVVWGPRNISIRKIEEINQTLNHVYDETWIEVRAVSDWDELR